MLTLLVPLGSAVAGGAAIARFWQSSAIARVFPRTKPAAVTYPSVSGPLDFSQHQP
jgi:hypothetical protein